MIKFSTIFKYFWLQIRHYKAQFFGIFILVGIGIAAADIFTPLIYRELIDTISNATDRASAANTLMHLLGLIGGSFLLYNITYRRSDFLWSDFATKVTRDLHNDAFNRVQQHSYSFFVNTFAGSLVAKLRRYARAFHSMFFTVVIRFWMLTVQFVGVLIALIFVAPWIALFLFSWATIYISITAWINIKKRPLDLAYAASDSRVTAGLADSITNVLNIKMFSSLRGELVHFGGITEAQRIAHKREWRYSNWMQVFQGLALSILELVVMYIAIKLWINGSLTTGTVVLIQLYIGAMWHGLWTIGHAIMDFNRAIADAAEMIEVFQTPLETRDVSEPEQLRIEKGHIKFNEMTFHYGEGKENVFERFDFDLPAGQKIGLIGHSGAGKTTITKLILRFADVASGSITIDGQDIRNISQDDLRSQIAYVPQEPILFHRTLAENIGYGDPNASQAQIEEAAKKAHAHEFITSLPQGYDTLVGERGVKLSGGERQRVAIARAMLKDAPILILDEATSSLDAVSEKYIQEAFKELMKDRTTIVIAHRLSTIQKLDRIVVLEYGKIVEEGTHQELIAQKGVYNNFWEHQAGGFIE